MTGLIFPTSGMALFGEMVNDNLFFPFEIRREKHSLGACQGGHQDQIMVTFVLLSATGLGAVIVGCLAYRNYFNKRARLLEIPQE